MNKSFLGRDDELLEHALTGAVQMPADGQGIVAQRTAEVKRV
jgi:cytochrome c5